MWEAILGLYMGLTILITLVEFIASIGLNTLIFPSTLYEISKMNWFGCWFCFILISIFSPILLCIKFINAIIDYSYDFIYWLFHVGRKDDE